MNLDWLVQPPEEEEYQPGNILMSLVKSQEQPTGGGGRGPGPGPTGPVGDIEQMVKRMAANRYGWTGEQWRALHELVSRESSWNPQADNPTSSAYGLFQFLDSTRDNYGIGLGAGPRKQAKAGLRYIQDRYGDPLDALAFHDKNNWY